MIIHNLSVVKALKVRYDYYFFIANKEHGYVTSLEIYFTWTPVEVAQIQAFLPFYFKQH